MGGSRYVKQWHLISESIRFFRRCPRLRPEQGHDCSLFQITCFNPEMIDLTNTFYWLYLDTKRTWSKIGIIKFQTFLKFADNAIFPSLNVMKRWMHGSSNSMENKLHIIQDAKELSCPAEDRHVFQVSCKHVFRVSCKLFYPEFLDLRSFGNQQHHRTSVNLKNVIIFGHPRQNYLDLGCSCPRRWRRSPK